MAHIQKIKNRISISPLTISKMQLNDPVQDLAFSDPVRRLQRATGGNTTDTFTYPEEHDSNVVCLYIAGIVMVAIVAVACYRLARKMMSTASGNIVDTIVDTPELPDDKKEERTAKSTLAKRKQTILDLFETSEVTMVSNDIIMSY